MAYSGKYKPKNPQKYKGNVNAITYRSLKERRVMKFFDTNPQILEWASEEIVIPYYSRVDKKHRRYFPDFWVKFFSNKDNQPIEMILEYKPKVQTQPPNNKRPLKTSKQKKRFLMEQLTYANNQDKWEAAIEWCKERNLVFKVITEDTLKEWTGHK
jgi:hypothetical protein